MNKLALFAAAAGAALVPAGMTSAQVMHTPPNVVVHHPGAPFMAPFGSPVVHPGPNFRHRRLQRGFIMHPFWFGPQFHVQNWQLYGFSPPPRDHRWVRYYDDAYLIDGEGRVRDERRGLDWDQYGERWTMDDGIPSYYGRNDWRPSERDYEWVESQDHDDERDRYAQHAPGYGPPMGPAPGYGAPMGPAPGCQPPGPCGYGPGYGAPMGPAPGCQPPAPCGYGPGYGYGSYGYGYAYPIIIETTVVIGGGACCTQEIVEEVVETRPPPRRRHRRYVPPPPPPGERG
jgi:Ni/Co efflux regulator RcnB